MKLDALLCSCNESRMKGKTGSSKRGCYRRKMGISTKRGGGGGGGAGVVTSVPPRGWFGVVRIKKLLVKTKLTPHNNKNIIIIHNNTSIASNDEDNRVSSCLEPPPTSNIIIIKDKDGKPGDDSTMLRNEGQIDLKENPDDCVVATELGGDQEEKLNKSDDDDVHMEKCSLMLGDVDSKAAADVSERKQDEKEMEAAIRIQTAFRSHLARRALRGLKSLVRLQAVVRGVVVRRQARMALHCMRALIRLGDRVRIRQMLLTHHQ